MVAGSVPAPGAERDAEGMRCFPAFWYTDLLSAIGYKEKDRKTGRKGSGMKRVIGLILFCTGVGMALMLLLPERFSVLCIIATLILVGYNLFCN